MLTLSNLVQTITIDNQVTFTNWDDLIWNNTNYTFKAQLKNQDTDWWIDIYDAWGEYVNGASGHTTNGLVDWTWDLMDYMGNLRDTLENDPFFDPYITFDATSSASAGVGGAVAAAAQTTRQTPIAMHSYPALGSWIVTYLDTFYEPGTTAGDAYIKE